MRPGRPKVNPPSRPCCASRPPNWAPADPKGYDTALAAADLLAEKVPEKSAAAKELVLTVHQKRFEAARGDDRMEAAQVYVADVLALAAADAQAGDYRRGPQAEPAGPDGPGDAPPAAARGAGCPLEACGRTVEDPRPGDVLKGQLKSETTAKAARDELVRLLVAELDCPQEAAKYLDASSDPLLRKYVPALCRKVDEAPEAACLELGDWLRKEADAAATAGGKAGMLRRPQPTTSGSWRCTRPPTWTGPRPNWP